MNILIPAYVIEALNILNDRGYQAYVVGGCVRDTFLGRPINDWDITTSALPEEIIESFKEYKVIPTGLKHGTITVHINHHPLEITTYRKETTYSDHRHPDEVIYVNSLHEDLSRRDFTINALAYNPNDGLIDLFEGVKDIDKRIIKCIGNSKDRFNEDALRILRALRFSSVLGFQIEEKTANSIRELKEELKDIAIERIKEEFIKLLEGKNRQEVLDRYLEVFEVFLPEITSYQGIEKIDDWESALGYLLKDKEYRSILNGLKFSNNEIKEIEHIIKFYNLKPKDKHELKVSLNNISGDIEACRKGIKLLDEPILFSYLEEIIKNNEAYCLKMLDINGNDLKELGFKDNAIGIELERLLEVVMKGELDNSKEELLKDSHDHLN